MVQFLQDLPRGHRAEALRALRSTTLRKELFALDGTPREGRPFTVTEAVWGLREEEPVRNPSSDRLRIFYPHPLAERTTQWERGNDPKTRFGFTDDYDAFGQPRLRVDIACARGWRRPEDKPGEPYLATCSRIAFAAPPDGSDVHIRDRIAQITNFEILNDGTETVLVLKEAAARGGSLNTIGQTLNFYDGPAFVGLSNGEVGSHGVFVRSESLVLTEEILQDAYKPDDAAETSPRMPVYLDPNAGGISMEEYPVDFLTFVKGLPQLAGFTFHAGDEVHRRGYFASSARNKFDFQDVQNSNPRGLLRVTRDALGSDPANGERDSRDTTVIYDDFDLLPVKIIDPVRLITETSYDHRVLQPREVIDPNGNRRRFTYSPLGLLRSTAVMGKEAESQGDTDEAPGRLFEYDLLAFKNSSPQDRVPVSVRSIQRVHHVTETDVTDENERNKFIELREYSDGFGRLLQTRIVAENDTAGDTIFGGALLPPNQSIDPGEIVLRDGSSRAVPNVIVSGAQRYDNKGRIVVKFEPYFELESGFQYRPPDDNQLGQKTTRFYDALGRIIRTVDPDGSEQRVTYGVPGTILNPELTNPDVFEPTPWETYTYDANDLAPLSRRPEPADAPGSLLIDEAPEHHHFTPSSIVVDSLDRSVLVIQRNREVLQDENGRLSLSPVIELRTQYAYDIRSNLVSVTDALLRPAFQYVYNLADTALRVANIDAGTTRIVLDAVGNEVERRDSKGSLILQAYDLVHRSIRLWARDDRESDTVPTLRQRLEYGDGGAPSQAESAREENRDLNRLGQLTRHYDEAGLLEFKKYDFKGNVLEKVRRVIRDEAVLRVFPAQPDANTDWNIRAFRVNWEPLEDQEPALLDENGHEISASYDALNQLKSLQYPQDVDGQRKKLRPTYNRAGALERLSLDGVSLVDHIAYDAKGHRTLVALGNGVLILYSYDSRTSRVRRLLSAAFSKDDERTFRPKPLTSPEARKDNLYQDFVYEYDLCGNISRIRDRTPGCGILNSILGRDALDRIFEYDALYRLTVATGRQADAPSEDTLEQLLGVRPRGADPKKAHAYREQYHYDLLGSVKELKHATFNGRSATGTFVRSFENRLNTNRLAQMAFGQRTFEYLYDENGNTVQENRSRHFEWDHSNRIKVFRNQISRANNILAEPSVHAQYLYDSAGTRIKKITRKQGGLVEVTEYVDGSFELQRSSDIENNTLHIMDGQKRIASIRIGRPFSDDGTPPVKYDLCDHLGSSNVVLGERGEFVNREEYTPYGDTSFGSFGRKRYRFTGNEKDEESGLCYYGARYYAPWISRWVSPDPIGLTDGLNLYCYCQANPLRFQDPSGMQARPTPEEEAAGMSLSDLAVSSVSNPWEPGAVTFKELTKDVIEQHLDPHLDLDLAKLLPQRDYGCGVAEVVCAAERWVSNNFEDLARKIGFSETDIEFFRMAPLVAPIIEIPPAMGVSSLRSAGSNSALSLGQLTDQVPATGALSIGIGQFNQTNLGGGRVFSHFTNVEGIRGITGAAAEGLSIGETISVEELRFAYITNEYIPSEVGKVYVTPELGPQATTTRLESIGVFGEKQNFVIQYSEETAFSQGVRATLERPGIYYIPGGITLRGQFSVSRLR